MRKATSGPVSRDLPRPQFVGGFTKFVSFGDLLQMAACMCQGKVHFYLIRPGFLRRFGHKAKQNGLQL